MYEVKAGAFHGYLKQDDVSQLVLKDPEQRTLYLFGTIYENEQAPESFLVKKIRMLDWELIAQAGISDSEDGVKKTYLSCSAHNA